MHMEHLLRTDALTFVTLNLHTAGTFFTPSYLMGEHPILAGAATHLALSSCHRLLVRE